MNDAVRDDVALGVAGFSFADLYDPPRLRDLHAEFWRFAEARSSGLRARFDDVSQESVPRPKQSDVLIEVAAHIGDFLAGLFKIAPDVERLAEETRDIEKIFEFKQKFLKTRIYKRLGEPAVDDATYRALDEETQRLLSAVPPRQDPEIRFADAVLLLLSEEKPTEG